MAVDEYLAWLAEAFLAGFDLTFQSAIPDHIVNLIGLILMTTFSLGLTIWVILYALDSEELIDKLAILGAVVFCIAILVVLWGVESKSPSGAHFLAIFVSGFAICLVANVFAAVRAMATLNRSQLWFLMINIVIVFVVGAYFGKKGILVIKYGVLLLEICLLFRFIIFLLSNSPPIEQLDFRTFKPHLTKNL